jgi:hypothetical protein
MNKMSILTSNSYSSIIKICFENPDFFPLVHQQQLTMLGFVSNCGGSLGLFLGFSALSAVEIVYYLTLRLLCLKSQHNKVRSFDHNPQAERKNYLAEIMETSSIHGLNQTSKKNRHFIERFSNF